MKSYTNNVFKKERNKKQTNTKNIIFFWWSMRQTRFDGDRRKQKNEEINIHCLLRKTHKHVNQYFFFCWI